VQSEATSVTSETKTPPFNNQDPTIASFKDFVGCDLWVMEEDNKPTLARAQTEPIKKPNPFNRSATRELCHECNKAIYAAERQVVGKFAFHRLCAGIYIEKELKKAPVFSISEEKMPTRTIRTTRAAKRGCCLLNGATLLDWAARRKKRRS
jgi:hypothetical protein